MQVKSPLESDTPESVVKCASVRTLRSVEELESIRSFGSCSAGSRDSDSDVFLTVLRSDSTILSPHVLVVEHDDKRTALLAGRIVPRPLIFKIGYLRIFNPLANVMTFPCGSLRGDSCSEVLVTDSSYDEKPQPYRGGYLTNLA